MSEEMLFSKILGGSGQRLADRLLDNITVPALGFWAFGILFLSPADRLQKVEALVDAGKIGSIAVMLALLVGAALISGGLVSAASGTMLELLLGNWPYPFSIVGRPIARLHVARRTKEEEELQALTSAAQSDWEKLSTGEAARYAELDQKTRFWPADERQIGPTELGILFRAFESRVAGKYGLEPAIVWPRLEVTLGADARAPIDALQTRLQEAAALAIWIVLIPFWIPAAYWFGAGHERQVLSWGLLPLAIILFVLNYRGARATMERLTESMEALFDMGRPGLYRALRLRLPRNAAEELELGADVTAYLHRGSNDPTRVFEEEQTSRD